MFAGEATKKCCKVSMKCACHAGRNFIRVVSRRSETFRKWVVFLSWWGYDSNHVPIDAQLTISRQNLLRTASSPDRN